MVFTKLHGSSNPLGLTVFTMERFVAFNLSNTNLRQADRLRIGILMQKVFGPSLSKSQFKVAENAISKHDKKAKVVTSNIISFTMKMHPISRITASGIKHMQMFSKRQL